MNSFQLRIIMEEARGIIDNFKVDAAATTEERRLAAKYEQIQFLSAELELLDRLVSMLDAGVEALEDKQGTIAADTGDSDD